MKKIILNIEIYGLESWDNIPDDQDINNEIKQLLMNEGYGYSHQIKIESKIIDNEETN